MHRVRLDVIGDVPSRVLAGQINHFDDVALISSDVEHIHLAFLDLDSFENDNLVVVVTSSVNANSAPENIRSSFGQQWILSDCNKFFIAQLSRVLLALTEFRCSFTIGLESKD